MKKYVKCRECGKLFKYIVWAHLRQHDLTPEQYRKKYPHEKFVSEISLNKMKNYQRNHNPMKGKKNPSRLLLNKLQSGENHPNYGKPLPEEIRMKISRTKKRLFREGKIKHPWIGRRHTKESNEKNRISHLRENLSKETRDRMSKAQRGRPSHRDGVKIEIEYGKDIAQKIKDKISNSKKGKYVGRDNPRWNGGIKISRGYIFRYKPEHLFNVQGYVFEHRLVMEKHIGRLLRREEEVHHINGIKNDNGIENLMLLRNTSEHRKLHRGELGSNWRGGLSSERYPIEFNDALKIKIRLKYKSKCQLCGIHENDLKGYFKKLAIHHINYIKKDCGERNLIPLCHVCNIKTGNGDRENWTRIISKKVV